jgi:hypothetical protein
MAFFSGNCDGKPYTCSDFDPCSSTIFLSVWWILPGQVWRLRDFRIFAVPTPVAPQKTSQKSDYLILCIIIYIILYYITLYDMIWYVIYYIILYNIILYYLSCQIHIYIYMYIVKWIYDNIYQILFIHFQYRKLGDPSAVQVWHVTSWTIRRSCRATSATWPWTRRLSWSPRSRVSKVYPAVMPATCLGGNGRIGSQLGTSYSMLQLC